MSITLLQFHVRFDYTFDAIQLNNKVHDEILKEFGISDFNEKENVLKDMRIFFEDYVKSLLTDIEIIKSFYTLYVLGY